MAAPRYRLKLERLDFISAVDRPAQETAKVLLIKRAGDLKGSAAVVKVDDELGLVFCWAFTSTTGDGSDHFDLQGDCIDQDFVKACADFMTDGGGAVDEMHDSNATGRVVFAMPMTPDVAKAFGVVSKTIGLMIALKPSATALAKFKDGTYTGVSIAGTGTRETVKRLDAVKMAPTGKCADCGKDMPVDIAKCASCGGSMAYKRAAVDDGVPVFVVEESPFARAPQSKSTRSIAVPSVNPMSTKESPMPTETETAKIADLEKQLTAANAALLLAKQQATLTDAHRAHLGTITGPDADAFVAKTVSERNAIVGPIDVLKRAADAEANAIVYTGNDGAVYRKRDDERTVALAKRVDAAEATARTAQIEKRAGELLSCFSKSLSVRARILKAVEAEFTVEAERTEALECLKGANAAMQGFNTMKGINPAAAPGTESPLVKFQAELATFAKSIGKSVAQATGDFLRTPEGADLYAAINESHPQAHQS